MNCAQTGKNPPTPFSTEGGERGYVRGGSNHYRNFQIHTSQIHPPRGSVQNRLFMVWNLHGILPDLGMNLPLLCAVSVLQKGHKQTQTPTPAHTATHTFGDRNYDKTRPCFPHFRPRGISLRCNSMVQLGVSDGQWRTHFRPLPLNAASGGTRVGYGPVPGWVFTPSRGTGDPPTMERYVIPQF